MTDRTGQHESSLDLIIQALETSPDVKAPDDFAARVMARVPRQPQRRYVLLQSVGRQRHVGRALAIAALVLLVCGMLVLAPHTTASTTWLLLQALLFTQFVGLLLWMMISHKQLR